MHLCSAHFDRNKILITSSEVLNIQDVCKIFKSESFVSEQRKLVIKTYISEKCVFKYNLKITFKLSYVIFYLTLTLHLQYTSPFPITVQFLLFTKSQFTRNTQNILHPNLYTHGHI